MQENGLRRGNATAFISYRRQDSADICNRITDHLERRYGKRRIFRDVSTLLAGSVFPDALRRALDDCRVALVLIGPQWLNIRNERGERRLDDPADFVRLEVATALREGKLVIPVLLRGARMPQPEELPANLRALALCRPFVARGDPYFRDDMAVIYRAIGGLAARRPAHLGVLIGGIIITASFALSIATTAVGLRPIATFSAAVALCAVAVTIILALLRALTARRWLWLAVPVAMAASLVGSISLQARNTLLFYFCLIALCALPLAFGTIGPIRIRHPRLERSSRSAWRRSSLWILSLSILSLLGIGAFGVLAILRIHGTFDLAAALLADGIIVSFAPWLLALWRCLRTRHYRWLLALLATVGLYLLSFILVVALALKGIAGLSLAVGPDTLLLGLLIGFGWWGLRQGQAEASANASANTTALEPAIGQSSPPVLPTF